MCHPYVRAQQSAWMWPVVHCLAKRFAACHLSLSLNFCRTQSGLHRLPLLAGLEWREPTKNDISANPRQCVPGTLGRTVYGP